MDKIMDYLTGERKQKPTAAEKISSSFARHADIRAELETWIDSRAYPKDNPLSVAGYTAEQIAKLAPFMDGVGVYNFLVSLRERPDNAKRIIAEGFPRK